MLLMEEHMGSQQTSELVPELVPGNRQAVLESLRVLPWLAGVQ